ncbi:MAG TPA: D-alanine--D-alanine ligase [Gemmatimonadaceae bacterium]|nr:D-alanine--D-alanine ligase [Gemmatimonadaceae bacterium]
MKITVLLGGTSAERDVSLASGLRVADALRSRGHRVTAIDPARGPLPAEEERALLARPVVQREPPSPDELAAMAREALPQMQRVLPALREADVVFLGLHGGAGEDGTIQALLDLAGVRYTGSGRLASALAMDKDLSKRLFRDNGVTTADWVMAPVSGVLSPEAILSRLGLPVVVKPSKQGSTVGLSVVKQSKDLAGAITEAFRYDDEVMLEQFIAGREITVGILGGEALPVGEIIPKHEIYDYECKYQAGMAVEEFPARISREAAELVQEQARRAFAALKLSGCARIDFRMAQDGGMYCLEANTLPGMTQTSLIPQAAAAAGMDFPALCERIARLALDDRGAGAAR